MVIAVAHDRHVIRDSQNGLVVLLHKFCTVCSVVVLYPDISAKADLLCVLLPAQLKGISLLEPVVRCLHLVAVLDLLLEHTVAVADTAAVGRISEGSQGIQEAGRQTAKASVPESRVRLLVLDGVQVNAHLIQGFFYFPVSCHVDQVVPQGPAHQKLHGHIINCLRVIFLELVLCGDPVVDDGLLYRVGHCLEKLLRRRLIHSLTVKCLYIVFYFLLKSLFFKSGIIHFSIPFLEPYLSTPMVTFSPLIFHSFTYPAGAAFSTVRASVSLPISSLWSAKTFSAFSLPS